MTTIRGIESELETYFTLRTLTTTQAPLAGLTAPLVKILKHQVDLFELLDS